MLIVPESKVLVPLLVMRTAVSTAPKETSPPLIKTPSVPRFKVAFETQLFPVIFVITILPEAKPDASAVPIISPEVDVCIELPPDVPKVDVAVYPDVVYVGVPPVPS